MTLQPRENGKFQLKSLEARKIRSIRATSLTWVKFGDSADKRDITRADLLEELVDNLAIEDKNKSTYITPIELEVIVTTLKESLNLKGNATSKIKVEISKVLAMLEAL